jgi:hypothetical protein
MRDSIKEALKELARTGLIAALPVLVSMLQAGTFDYKVLITAVAIALLRAIDKYVHEEPSINAQGIIPF